MASTNVGATLVCNTRARGGRVAKRRAVLTLLNDEEWREWSDREIARRCAVHHVFVGDMRKAVTGDNHQSATRKGADGRTINTANIGKPKQQPEEVADAQSAEPEEGDTQEVDDQLRRHAAEVKRNVANALHYLVEAGAELAKARDLLRHNKRGGFELWAKEEAGVSKRHAYHMIAIHGAFGNSALNARLQVGYTTAHKLAANPIALEKVQARALGGQDVTEEYAREVLRPSAPPPPQPDLVPTPPLTDVLPETGTQAEDVHGAYGTEGNTLARFP